jgi:hypothetical protein
MALLIPLLALTLTTITSMQLQNKQASRKLHVHTTVQPPKQQYCMKNVLLSKLIFEKKNKKVTLATKYLNVIIHTFGFPFIFFYHNRWPRPRKQFLPLPLQIPPNLLKGKCHEIFAIRIFSLVIFYLAPCYPSTITSIYFEISPRYMQSKVHHLSHQH